jgi:hypothetical protein
MPFLLTALPCIAAPPADADLDGCLHAWFEHQHSVTGAAYRPGAALRDPLGAPNPTGHAVVWWTRAGNETVILRFAPGSEL